MAALAFGGIRPLTSKKPSMGECICGHVGRAACWAAWLPRVSAHERGCYSGNILSPPFPGSGKVCCIHGQRELGKPQRKAICSCWGKYCKMGGKKKAWVIVSTVKAVIQNPNWGKRWLINNVPGFFSPRESLNCATTFIAELTWSIV